MRYASVCDGIGAAHAAWQPLGWECAWTSEIEPFPCSVVEQRWGFANLGDMTRITDEQLREHGPVDLLVGGTPCQSFSVAGLRKGLADPRGNLALSYLGLADRVRPRWIVWENVVGVLSSGRGRDFGAFLGALGQLGYGFAYRVLDAQYCRVQSHPRAVPQRRRRVFVVGCLGDWRGAAAVLLEREGMCGHPPPRRVAGQGLAADAAPSLVASGRGVERTGETREQDPVVAIQDCQPRSKQQNGKGWSDDGVSYTVDRTACQGVVQPTAHTLRAEGFDASEDGTGRGTPLVPEVCGTLSDGAHNGGGLNGQDAYTGRVIPHINTTCDEGQTPVIGFANTAGATNLGIQEGVMPPLTRRNGDPGMIASVDPYNAAEADTASSLGVNCGISTGRNGVRNGLVVRRLTPRECERLQGFPDDYTAITYRGKPAADGPRYKALGNSMAINVVSWIGQRIAAVDGEMSTA